MRLALPLFGLLLAAASCAGADRLAKDVDKGADTLHRDANEAVDGKRSAPTSPADAASDAPVLSF